MDISKETTGNIVNSTIGLFIAIIYAIVITFIVNFKTLREKKSNQLLLNLCFGHLLAGLLHFSGLFTIFPVGALVFSGYVYITISLLVISVDRFIFIRYPFRYKTEPFNQIHIGFMLASPFSFIIYLGRYLLTKFGKDISTSSESMMSFAISFITIVVILLYLNFTVYGTICKQRKSIQAHCKIAPIVIAPAAVEETVNPLSTRIQDSMKKTRTKTRTREARAFYSCFGCVFSFTLLWMPCLLIVILKRFFNVNVPDIEFKLALALAGFNPLSDILIFVWFNVELRVLIKKTTRKLFQRNIRKLMR